MIGRAHTLSALLLLSVGFCSVVYFQLDTRDLKAGIWTVLQTCFLLLLLVFVVQYLVTHGFKVFRSRTSKSKSEEEEEALHAEYRQASEKSRQEIQRQHALKAESFKERILTPRDEARKAKKEEEFRRFMGPAWKGSGQPLGGEEIQRSSEGQGSRRDDRSAAEVRQLPVNVREPVEQAPEEPRQRKKIVLPEEPTAGHEHSIVVILKTPINTVHQRRFLTSHTVQVLLDYMTTLGFHQRRNNLVTSYPREILADPDKTLVQLGFEKRVVLNIEEII